MSTIVGRGARARETRRAQTLAVVANDHPAKEDNCTGGWKRRPKVAPGKGRGPTEVATVPKTLMAHQYWEHPGIAERLSQGAALLKQLAMQGKDADYNEMSELVIVLEGILRNAPVTAFQDREVRYLEAIVQLLREAIKHTPNPMEVESQEVESQDIFLETPRLNINADVSTVDSTDRPQRDDFDSFAGARRNAIENTLVTDTTSFPLFSEIAGLHEAKNAMIEALVDPILYPDYFRSSDLKPWKSVLLYGPPGTGKTILSQAVVREINGVLYQISSSDLISSWQGQSERLIRELFDHALRQDKTVIIFIDEVDSLCRTRNRNEDDANRRVKTEILVQLQRLQDSSRLILVCATNCPWELDPAFLRRLEKKIYAGLPDLEARVQILKMFLKNTTFEPGVDADFLAQLCDGFSGDDLSRFTSELAYAQFRKHKNAFSPFDSSHRRPPPLSEDEVRQVLDKFQPSVDSQQLALFQQFMTKR